MVNLRLLYAGRLEDGWCNVTDVVILVANFTFAFNSVRPVYDQCVSLAAAMLGLLEVAERGIAGHGPTRVIALWISVPLPPPFQVTHAGIERGLQAIEHVGFVECAGSVRLHRWRR